MDKWREGRRDKNRAREALTNHYSGTPLLWTPWGPNKVSCIERCPHFRDKFILRAHIWDIVLNTEVSLFQGCPSTVSQRIESTPSSNSHLPSRCPPCSCQP